MIINNKATEIGDVLLIATTEPVVGLVNIQSFTDITTGTTGTRFFTKEFMYSLNGGITFSEWLPLTNGNLLAIGVQKTNGFLVNYRYTRAGSDITGNLFFNEVTLLGVFDKPISTGKYYILPNSIFKDLYDNNPAHISLCAKLTKKFYETGIVPEYIERGLTGNIADDEDYLAFWDTVCCFFALIILFAKKFEYFDSDRNVLSEYLLQFNQLFSSKISQEDLSYMKSNYISEMRQRGTIQVFSKKDILKEIDGEFLRLIGYRNSDEFLVNLIPTHKSGWNIGNASPLFKGHTNQNQLNKSYESTTNINDITKYPTINTASISTVSEGLKSIMVLNDVGNDVVGIGSIDSTKMINVDPNMDYEICFWIKSSQIASVLSFGCLAFDISGNPAPLKNIFSGMQTTRFFTKKSLNIINTYYFVRGILYNQEAQTLSDIDSTLNIGYGNHLKMTPSVSKVIPYIVQDQTDSNLFPSNKLYLWDLKIRPLVSGQTIKPLYKNNITRVVEYNKSISNKYWRGGANNYAFLSLRNPLELYYKNNNTELSNQEVEENTSHYLIPYNCKLFPIRLQH